MKKLFALLLAVMMTATLAVPAFAATAIDGNNATSAAGKDEGNYTIGVNAAYQDGVMTVNKISVNVSWDAMEFTYSTGGTKTWDEKTHTYKDNATSVWSEGKTVTVTNHSDSAIKVEFDFKADTAYNTVTGSFDNASINLPTAVGKTTTASELTGTSTLTLSGTLNSSVTTSTKIGTITVKIAKASN